MKKLLTIVVPVYNRVERLHGVLDALFVALQRSAVVRLLLVDNGSTDGSLEACEAFVRRCEEEAIDAHLLCEPKRGASAARNTGLAATETEWVYFFDSDDLLSDNFCEQVVGWIDSYGSQLDMIAFPVLQEVNGRLQVKPHVATERPQAQILLHGSLCTVSMAFRTAWLRRVGGWDERLTTWDDWELGVRALLARPRLRWFTERAFHHVFVHSESQTGASFSQTLAPIITAMEVVLSGIENAATTVEEVSVCRLALYYRSCIMSGKLVSEGSREGQSAFRQFALLSLPSPSWRQRLMGKFLEAYTAHGGHGAWRIILRFLV